MKKLICVLVCVFALGVAGFAHAQQQNGDQTFLYSDEDSRMNAAQAQARASLPNFFAVFDRAPPDAQRAIFLLKVGLPAGGGGSEHIWVNDLHREGTRLMGVLANSPNDLPGLHQGSPVAIVDAQISDWIIQTPDGMYGAFTIRVMLPDMPADLAREQREMLTDTPLPPSWTQ